MPNPYCQKRHGTYYLRIRIPKDMHAVLGVQIIRSLKTGRAEEARSLAAGMVSASPHWWAVLRQELMTKILGKSLADLTPEDLSRDNLQRLIAEVNALSEDEQKAFRQRRDELLREAYDKLVESKKDLSMARLAMEMMQHGQNVGLNKAMTFVGAGSGMRPAAVEVAEEPALTPRQKRGNEKAKLSLSELAEEFFKTEKQGSKSQVSYLAAFKGFAAVVGDKAIGNIDEDDLLAYRDSLSKQKGRDGREVAATATIQKNLGHIKAILTWAANPERRIILRNPGVDIAPPKKPKGATEDGVRLAFDEAQLIKIFNSPLFTGCTEASWKTPGPYVEREDRFYFFLTMFLTGARNDELPGAEIYDLAGIECLDLTKTGKKTPAGPRIVPILPELRATGFVDWAKARIAAGGQLFRGTNAVKKWGDFPSRYLRDIGVGGRLYSAYSLRHSHRQMLRGSGLADELIDKTFGHEGVKIGARYGRGNVSLQEGRAWLKAVKCSIDLSHLKIG